MLAVGVVVGDTVGVMDWLGVTVPLKDTVGELEEVKEMVGVKEGVLERVSWKQAAAEVAPGPPVVKPAAQEVQLADPVPLA